LVVAAGRAVYFVVAVGVKECGYVGGGASPSRWDEGEVVRT
jgi:hypothetical protein